MNQYHAAWAKTNWLTQKRHDQLLFLFKDLEDAWENISEVELKQMGVSPKKREEFFDIKNTVNPEREKLYLEKNNITLLYIRNQDYPQKLKHIEDVPVFLYLQGKWKKEFDTGFAIIGTRAPSFYGKKVTREFTRELGQNFAIVSGLAYGIDSIAHQECIQNNIPTIAVLGCGIDFIYTLRSKTLAEKIIQHGGVIISEFAPGTHADKFHFPKRNRIISGLSVGTLVVEGKKKSGSLITARLALEQNREVFAIPGSISSIYSGGPNHLIQSGQAKLVTCASDILEEFHIEKIQSHSQAQQQLTFGSNEEDLIFNTLSHEGMDISQMAESTQLESIKITSSLTLLEMKGLVENIGSGMWIKK